MDSRRLDLVRAAYRAWNEKGLAGLEPALSDAVELHDPGQMPDSGVWRGRDAVIERLDEVANAVSLGRVESSASASSATSARRDALAAGLRAGAQRSSGACITSSA